MRVIHRGHRLIAAISLGICCLSTAAVAAQTTDTPHPSQFIVFGADRTESYEDMTHLALRLAYQTLYAAQPGDELIYRWISDRSYLVDQVFAHVRLFPAPEQRNAFDPRARRQTQAIERQNYILKKQWLDHIAQQHPGSTPSTDIFGFITAAAEHFAQAPQGTEKWLILATDLDDNRRYQIQPELTGVKVTVYPLKNEPDPTRMQVKKTWWADYFKKCGAVSVEFIAQVIE